MKKDLPELLSPCGSREALEAAAEGGADAVYFGGTMLNARMNAKNFDRDEKIAAVTAIYNKLGVDRMTQEAINSYFEESRSIFNSINIEEDRKHEVWNFISSLVGRKI